MLANSSPSKQVKRMSEEHSFGQLVVFGIAITNIIGCRDAKVANNLQLVYPTYYPIDIIILSRYVSRETLVLVSGRYVNYLAGLEVLVFSVEKLACLLLLILE